MVYSFKIVAESCHEIPLYYKPIWRHYWGCQRVVRGSIGWYRICGRRLSDIICMGVYGTFNNSCQCMMWSPVYVMALFSTDLLTVTRENTTKTYCTRVSGWVVRAIIPWIQVTTFSSFWWLVCIYHAYTSLVWSIVALKTVIMI